MDSDVLENKAADTKDLSEVEALPTSEELLVPDPRTSLARLSPLQRYLLEIRHFRALSAEEEFKLAVQYREEGDQEAAYRLVTANLSLVVKIARLYGRVYQNVIDLIQEGNIGLIEAVKRFDPYRGNRLPTYASWWIKAYVIKFLLDNFRIVRVGTTNERRKLLFNLRKEKERLRLQGIEPTPQLIAERLNVSVEDVQAVERNIETGDISLDAPARDESPTAYGDTLKAPGELVDEQLARRELQELFNSKLAEFSQTLNERERVILEERLIAEQAKTLQEIAGRFGVTREAIRLSERALISKIKKHMEKAFGEVTDVEFALLR